MKPKMDWCDVNELIHHTINSLKEELENRSVLLFIDNNLPLCKLDRILMEQVIKNLVLNANIYTEKLCRIEIKAGIHNEKLQITVEDDGDGFPEKEMPYVFDKFYRLKHAKPGGTGLGLSIVKGFVEVHQGKIILENKPIGGAKFTITIPVETNDINNYSNE
jgi:two-component system sensor histidine kinase KdpD